VLMSNEARNTAAEAAEYLQANVHPTRGLETLAIIWSLP
jgi:hypothetical protein